MPSISNLYLCFLLMVATQIGYAQEYRLSLSIDNGIGRNTLPNTIYYLEYRGLVQNHFTRGVPMLPFTLEKRINSQSNLHIQLLSGWESWRDEYLMLILLYQRQLSKKKNLLDYGAGFLYSFGSVGIFVKPGLRRDRRYIPAPTFSLMRKCYLDKNKRFFIRPQVLGSFKLTFFEGENQLNTFYLTSIGVGMRFGKVEESENS